MNKFPTNAARTLSPLLLILFFCAGCNPNIDVDGALLPAGADASATALISVMVPMMSGLTASSMSSARALLIRTGIDRFLVARALVYVSITITFSCLVWLIVFRY